MFTGSIAQTSTLGPAAVSIFVDRPGDITFYNCTWRDMTAPSGILFLSSARQTLGGASDNQDGVFLLPPSQQGPNRTRVTMINCTFREIIHRYPLLSAYGQQTMVIDGGNFSRIIPDPLNRASCATAAAWGNDDGWGERCTYLVACEENASCDVQKSCRTTKVEELLDENYAWLYKSENATVHIDKSSQECGFNTTASNISAN